MCIEIENCREEIRDYRKRADDVAKRVKDISKMLGIENYDFTPGINNNCPQWKSRPELEQAIEKISDGTFSNPCFITGDELKKDLRKHLNEIEVGDAFITERGIPATLDENEITHNIEVVNDKWIGKSLFTLTMSFVAALDKNGDGKCNLHEYDANVSGGGGLAWRVVALVKNNYDKSNVNKALTPLTASQK